MFCIPLRRFVNHLCITAARFMMLVTMLVTMDEATKSVMRRIATAATDLHVVCCMLYNVQDWVMHGPWRQNICVWDWLLSELWMQCCLCFVHCSLSATHVADACTSMLHHTRMSSIHFLLHFVVLQCSL